jgi:hypothetical protein
VTESSQRDLNTHPFTTIAIDDLLQLNATIVMPLIGQDENLPPNQSIVKPKFTGNLTRKLGNLSTLNLNTTSTIHSGASTRKQTQSPKGGHERGLLTPPASQTINTLSILSPPPETQLEAERRTKTLVGQNLPQYRLDIANPLAIVREQQKTKAPTHVGPRIAIPNRYTKSQSEEAVASTRI